MARSECRMVERCRHVTCRKPGRTGRTRLPTGLPRSFAPIYHSLCVAEKRLSFTEIVDHAGIAQGSASTGLEMLARMHAVKVVDVAASRSSYYRPELSLRRIAAGFLKQSLLRSLEAGGRVYTTPPLRLTPAASRTPPPTAFQPPSSARDIRRGAAHANLPESNHPPATSPIGLPCPLPRIDQRQQRAMCGTCGMCFVLCAM